MVLTSVGDVVPIRQTNLQLSALHSARLKIFGTISTVAVIASLYSNSFDVNPGPNALSVYVGLAG
jgi:hypothetical protein